MKIASRSTEKLSRDVAAAGRGGGGGRTPYGGGGGWGGGGGGGGGGGEDSHMRGTGMCVVSFRSAKSRTLLLCSH